MQKITSIHPFLFEGYLVIVLHQDWIQKFNGIPTIDAFLDNENHLCLVSKETVRK